MSSYILVFKDRTDNYQVHSFTADSEMVANAYADGYGAGFDCEIIYIAKII